MIEREGSFAFGEHGTSGKLKKKAVLLAYGWTVFYLSRLNKIPFLCCP